MVEIRRGGGRRGEGGGGQEGEGEETDIKSNNPHLTGGEKISVTQRIHKHDIYLPTCLQIFMVNISYIDPMGIMNLEGRYCTVGPERYA